MHYCIRLAWLIVLLAGCQQEQPQNSQVPVADSWSNEDEVVFQTAEALRHSVEQQKLEISRLRAQGLEGNPPSSR